MQNKLIFVKALNMQTLQLMKNIPKTFMTIQTIMFPLWFFKHTKMQFSRVSTHLGGSLDCDFTLMLVL
jgi:hypothetical protein